MAKRPSYRRSALTGLPGGRMPKGWGLTPESVFERGIRQLTVPKGEPAGDPPPDWQGTRPEWAVFWALGKLGFEPGVDFEYQTNVPGLEGGDVSVLDFTIRSLHLALEIQGSFWHTQQGSEKQATDVFRRARAQAEGITIIFIDEEDALSRPIEIVRAALNFEDRSVLGR